jgi:hypothetical protein
MLKSDFERSLHFEGEESLESRLIVICMDESMLILFWNMLYVCVPVEVCVCFPQKCCHLTFSVLKTKVS